VERAIEVIKEILAGERDNMDPSKPPWVVCNEFGPYALNIYMIYWFRVPDQFASLEFANKVNMQILRRFEAEGIKIALPAQTLHLADDVGGRLASGEGKGARSARS
jgi:MscS family membrane protein